MDMRLTGYVKSEIHCNMSGTGEDLSRMIDRRPAISEHAEKLLGCLSACYSVQSGRRSFMAGLEYRLYREMILVWQSTVYQRTGCLRK